MSKEEDAIREYLNSKDIHLLEDNEVFHFSCKQCGKCCTNREGMQSIILNPKDIFNIAKNLNMKTEEVVMKYGNPGVGDSSKLPLVYIKNTNNIFDPEPSCIFKNGNGCGIHGFKPIVCKLFPLGRVSSFEKEDNTNAPPVVKYMVQDVNCDGSKPTRNNGHTVDEWLPNRAEEEAYFVAFNKLMQDMTKTHHTEFVNSDSVPDAVKTQYLQSVAFMLYVGYNMEDDFTEQFSKRCEDIIDLQLKMSMVFEELELHYKNLTNEQDKAKFKNSNRI